MKIAFIPVRGGSKSIPLKNIKPFAGRPLVYWVLKASEECSAIDRIFVATDHEQIKNTVLSFGLHKVQTVGRSSQSATDTATTETAMLEFAKQHEFDQIALIQATSPLLTARDLAKGFHAMQDADSVLSVVRQKRFLWVQNEHAEPLNYDYQHRPRRQEFEGFFVENGAFYITSRKALLQTGCRLSGKIQTVEMPEESYFEIDEETDWIIAERLLERRQKKSGTKGNIKLFLTDCDGTLTDGSMYYTAEGDVMKQFNTRDGVGLRLLKEQGILTGILTGEDSECVRRRGEKLEVDIIRLSATDKGQVITELCRKYGVKMEEVAYIGDDWNDLEALKQVGLAICPADAVPQIKEVATYVTRQAGGHGAVREAAEYVLSNWG